MKTDEFLSIVDNPNLISGIHNYCDRWCERCSMTNRCSVYLTTPKLDHKDFADDEVYFNEVFKSVSDSFRITMALLEQFAEERGIDLTPDEEDDTWFEENQFPKDSDGSAKVALIGIDSSIQAWGVLLQHLSQQEDIILPILSRLEHLRKSIETSFPDARAFKRPGFDA